MWSACTADGDILILPLEDGAVSSDLSRRAAAAAGSPRRVSRFRAGWWKGAAWKDPQKDLLDRAQVARLPECPTRSRAEVWLLGLSS